MTNLPASSLSRRQLLQWFALSSTGMALAACVPPASPTESGDSEGGAASATVDAELARTQ